MPIASIFVSSVQKELAEERLAIRDFVQGAALLRRFFTNADYQRMLGCSRRTALRELTVLVQVGVLLALGSGHGAHYVLVAKRASNAPNAPLRKGTAPAGQRARIAPNGTSLAPRPGKTKGTTKGPKERKKSKGPKGASLAARPRRANGDKKGTKGT